MLWYKLLLLGIALLLFSQPVSAALRITEVYPAPAGSDFEWVELHNTDTTTLQLSDYILKDAASKQIPLPSVIEAHGYAIATASSVLNNSNETITLYKGLEIIESVSYTPTLDATKSYARCADNELEWKVTPEITKGSPNLILCKTPSPTSTPIISPSLTPIPLSPTPSIALVTPESAYAVIFINEAMVYPTTGEQEWVELYNASDNAIDIYNWYIDDEDGGGSPKKFSLTIAAHSYEVVELSSSLFNNSDDSVRILNESKTEITNFSYETSKSGTTWGKPATSSEYCIMVPSKKTQNSSCTGETASNIAQSTATTSKTTSKTAATSSSVKGTSTSSPIEMYRGIGNGKLASKQEGVPFQQDFLPIEKSSSQKPLTSKTLILIILNGIAILLCVFSFSLLLIKMNAVGHKISWPELAIGK